MSIQSLRSRTLSPPRTMMMMVSNRSPLDVHQLSHQRFRHIRIRMQEFKCEFRRFSNLRIRTQKGALTMPLLVFLGSHTIDRVQICNRPHNTTGQSLERLSDENIPWNFIVAYHNTVRSLKQLSDRNIPWNFIVALPYILAYHKLP